MAIGCKNQMITLTEEGAKKLRQCENQAESERTGQKRQVFLNAAWGAIREQITERIQEMGTYIDQDVRGKMNGMCEMFRVDIGSVLTNFQEKQQELEQCIRDVANAMDGRLVESNRGNSNQESLLGELSDAVIGLIEEMGESRDNAQKNSGKQRK